MCKSNSHNHDHPHSHDHNNTSFNKSLLMFLVALIMYVSIFNLEKGSISLVLHIFIMVLAGSHVVVEGIVDTIDQSKQKKKFTPNVHILMTLAAFGSIFIGEYREGALLILIFAGAHFLEDYAQSKSTKEISNLMSLQPSIARKLNGDGSVEEVDIDSLIIGDKVQVLNGGEIPVDGIVYDGMSSVNQSSITGESVPVEKSIGDEVFGSTINGNGSLIIEVTKESKDTVISKIIEMVSQTQNNVSTTAAFIKRLEPIYVKIVLLIAPLFFVLGLLVFKWNFETSFYRTMVFLIVSSPCALAATDIPATLSAISNLARNGILFKGGSFLSNLSEVKAIAFDKTGTITKGKPEVVSWEYVNEDIDRSLINQIVYSMEYQNNHPLASAILNYLGNLEVLDLVSENLIGSGINASYDSDQYYVGKVSEYANSKIKETVINLQSQGQTVVTVEKNGNIILLIGIIDSAKESASDAIRYLNSNDIDSIMISGDSTNTAQSIADSVGINSVYGSVMPDEKSNIISKLKDEYGMIAMLGDGVNDAPALVNADIGIAMGNGSDVAIDVADAVLIENDLSKLVYTLKVSKKLRKVVLQNIIFAMAVVVFLIIMNILGRMDMTLAVIVHEGSTFVVLINGLRLLKQIRN